MKLGRLVADSIWRMLKKRGKMAGLAPFSPHDFRRTFCSDLMDCNVDLVTVQKLVGHSSPLTTAKYDRRGEKLSKEQSKIWIFDILPTLRNPSLFLSSRWFFVLLLSLIL